MIVESRQQPV